jgi:hypothetical protein
MLARKILELDLMQLVRILELLKYEDINTYNFLKEKIEDS